MAFSVSVSVSVSFTVVVVVSVRYISTQMYIYIHIYPPQLCGLRFYATSSVFLWLFLLRLAFFVVNIMILPDWLVRFSLVWFLGLNLTWLAYFCGYYSILFFLLLCPNVPQCYAVRLLMGP